MSGSGLVANRWCLTMLQLLGSCISFCLARQMFSEQGAKHSSVRQVITPAEYDEGTLGTNHNAATRETGHGNTLVCGPETI